MEIIRPTSAQSHTTEASQISIRTETTAVDLPAAPKTLAETLVSRRLPAHNQTSSYKEGFEGRRRRRRYEMQNLLGCPVRVEPLPEDWNIGPLYDTKIIPWDKAIDVDPAILQDMKRSSQDVGRSPNVLPRALRDNLKRMHVNHEFVRDIETRIRDVFDPAPAEPEYDVVDVSSLDEAEKPRTHYVRISTDATTSSAQAYSRYWVHLIARFYGMRSCSEDVAGIRVATVECAAGKRLPSTWFSDLLQ
ncbi:hypothetical protein MRB53_039077 [Persea americana]|nr:hypothetical protein MRB53_039077 [Persea americana]